MPRNGSGTYSLPAGNPVVTGTVISSTVQNNTTSDIATALTNSIAKDGQTTPTANLPMGGFKLTGLGTGSAATDSANLTQIQAQAYILLGAVAGTDTITATTNPVTTAYAAGQTYRFVAAATNTGAVTININSLGAKSITKNGASSLVAGDILINGLYQVTYDGTQFQLANTSLVSIAADSVTAATLADSALGVSMINGTLTASVAASALTIAIKTKAGADPSASDPVLIYFRNVTAGTGDYNVLSLTAATSFVVSSGSTLGTTSGVASRLWIVGFNDGGTFRLGAINLDTVVAIGDDTIASSTAEGGAGAADSAGVYYTGTAVTSKAMRVLGYVESMQATAGTWATTPSKVQLVSAIYGTTPPKSISVINSSTTVTASGTTIDFTNIPSWTKRITVMLAGVSTNGTSALLIQIGTSSGVETTGYVSTSARLANAGSPSVGSSTAGFLVTSNDASFITSGHAFLTHAGSNLWIGSHTCKLNTLQTVVGGGDKTLAAVIDRVRVTTVNGTDTFDAGSVNIQYE